MLLAKAKSIPSPATTPVDANQSQGRRAAWYRMGIRPATNPLEEPLIDSRCRANQSEVPQQVTQNLLMCSDYQPDPRHQTLGEAFFDRVEPARFPEAQLRFRNQRWAERVGLGNLGDEEWKQHFARFRPLPDNLDEALALRYHGHQFKQYNPDLGDGRGFLFAQLREPYTGRLLDLATKGSGRTPWSRTADGRLTLKGGVREVLAAEMLEALGVYTSKAFSLIETGEQLLRHDEPSPTRSAVLVRLGHGHIRIGTFQRLAFLRDRSNLERLLDYSIETYWPDADAPTVDQRAVNFLERVVGAVAGLGAQWTAAGFVHGVINTDNVMITSESFDYGPWRFLPRFEPAFTAAYFDHAGLYAFGNQPAALNWAVHRLADCLAVFTEPDRPAEVLATFQERFNTHLNAETLARLGLERAGSERDGLLVGAFYGALEQTDMPFERAFFDLIGGARPERLADSPQRDTYAAGRWDSVVKMLRGHPPATGIETALSRPYFKRSTPLTMLADDMEALWTPIAEADDWSALDDCLRDVADLRHAYEPLRLRPSPHPSAPDRAPTKD